MSCASVINASAINVSAIATFDGKKIKGTVRFIEDLQQNAVIIKVDIRGLKRGGRHGFHIHTYGDMSEQCTSMCAHFNPYDTEHGGPTDKIGHRHVGDLGNLQADSTGHAFYQFSDNIIRLRGQKANIIGRGLIIHADEDDLGLGGFPDSLTTGHAGERIACAVIGYARP
jgi:superoxide dismutase, Cu-Zn family